MHTSPNALVSPASGQGGTVIPGSTGIVM